MELELIEEKTISENCKAELLKYGAYYYVRVVDLDTGQSPGYRSYRTLRLARQYFKTFN